MTQASAAFWRKFFGRLSGLLLLGIVLAVIDGMSAQIRQEFNLIEIVPGQRQVVNGPMPRMTASLRELIVDLSSEALSLNLEETYTGFWMGGSMWKGQVQVASGSPAGQYILGVRGPGEAEANPALVFKIRVFADAEDQRLQSLSYIHKFLGPHPFILAAWLLPCALLAGLGNFVVSQQLETALARDHKAEIYVVKTAPEGLLLTFGLGKDHGLSVGDRADILDEAGRVTTTARIQEVRPGSCTALAPAGSAVHIGSLAAVTPGPHRA